LPSNTVPKPPVASLRPSTMSSCICMQGHWICIGLTHSGCCRTVQEMLLATSSALANTGCNGPSIPWCILCLCFGGQGCSNRRRQVAHLHARKAIMVSKKLFLTFCFLHRLAKLNCTLTWGREKVGSNSPQQCEQSPVWPRQLSSQLQIQCAA
jgi:hypothetical protein